MARRLSFVQFITGIVVVCLGYALTVKEPEALKLGDVDVRPLYRCYWPSFLIFFLATLGMAISSTFRWHDAPHFLMTVYVTVSLLTTVTCLAVGIVVALMASHMSAFDLSNCITLSNSQKTLYVEYGPVCLCSPEVLNGELRSEDPVDFFAFRSECDSALRGVTPLLKAASCILLLAGVQGLLATVMGCYGFAFTDSPSRSSQPEG